MDSNYAVPFHIMRHLTTALEISLRPIISNILRRSLTAGGNHLGRQCLGLLSSCESGNHLARTSAALLETSRALEYSSARLRPALLETS